MILVELSYVDGGREVELGGVFWEEWVFLSLFEDEVVVERVHQLDVDRLLVEDELLPERERQLFEDLEVVVLLVGQQASHHRHMHPLDLVFLIRLDLRLQY